MSYDQAAVLTPNSVNRDWLAPTEVNALTPAEIMFRLSNIRGLIASKAAEAERIRRPVDEVLSAIRRTGLFYLYVPKQFGGLEHDGLAAFIDTVALIAEECTSTAWCAAFTVNHQWLLTQFPEKLQQEIWSETPYLTTAGSGFPPGKLVKVAGGFRVTGRWRFGSGIMHAAWTSSLALLDHGGTKVPYYFFVPINEVTVLDTWFVDGMCGSGSHDYEIRDVFVPEHRAIDHRTLAPGQLHHKTPIYRLPLAPWLGISGAGVALGAARGAVQRFRERLATGGSGFREKTVTGAAVDKPILHVALGKADMQVKAAEFMIRTAAAELELLSRRDEHVSLADRVRLRAIFAYAADQCRAALRVLNDEGGTSAHYLSNPIQRALRDVTMLVSHKMYDFSDAMELHGRIMSGLPSNSDMFQ